MKKEINVSVKGKKIDETTLFRAMANELNRNSSCTYVNEYVEEIHGTKKLVIFESKILNEPKTVELGDLLLVTFDKETKELRICILQAKYKSGGYYTFLNFNANILQWELLKNKYTIKNKFSYNFPPNILNFRSDYKSITAYGIFYKDKAGQIDFLYTLPIFIKPAKKIKKPLKNFIKSFHFRCPTGYCNPDPFRMRKNRTKETISTCSIETFEKQLLLGKIGAPINDPQVKNWLLSILYIMKSKTSNPESIDTILNYFQFSNNLVADLSPTYFPATLVVVTDSNKYKEKLKNELKEKFNHLDDLLH